MGAGIYVEICIRADVDELWRKTQDPALHRRWDLRFTDIAYLQRYDEDEVALQPLLYATCIGIRGQGGSTGNREDAERR